MKLQQRDYIDLLRIYCRQPSPIWWAHVGMALCRTMAALPYVARYSHTYAATGSAQAAAYEMEQSKGACYNRLRIARSYIEAEIVLLSLT